MYSSETFLLLHAQRGCCLVLSGYMPPGHGYVPKKQKPDKPYGPSFNSIMNRTWRGPGEKYLYYALVCGCVAILFFTGAGTYWGLRYVWIGHCYRPPQHPKGCTWHVLHLSGCSGRYLRQCFSTAI